MTVLQRFTAGLFEGWTRLPMSDRCRVVIVALTVPCAVALVWSVRPSPRHPGALFLDKHDLEAAAEAQLDPWGVPYDFEGGEFAELAAPAQRAEVIVESDRVFPGRIAPAGGYASVSSIAGDALSPHVRSSRVTHPELRH